MRVTHNLKTLPSPPDGSMSEATVGGKALEMKGKHDQFLAF